MMKYIIFILVLFSTTFGLQAQTKKAYINAATEAFEKQDYYSAMAYFQKAVEFKTDDIDVLYQAAESSRRFNAYNMADSLYARVVELTDDGQYPDATFYLAQMKQKRGQYTKALEYYTQYLGESEGANTFLTQKTKKEIEAIKWAQKQIENAEKNEDSLINLQYMNSPYSDVGAYVIGDSIYFSSLRFEEEEDENDPNRIYSRMLISKDSTEGELVGNDLNSAFQHTAHTTFNKEKSRMYFTICEYITSDNIRCDLYYTDVKDGEFLPPVKLPEHINNDTVTSTQPSYGIDPVTGNEVLYYASNREGGKGQVDIWMIILEEDGFSEPINLSKINTAYDDITPFYDSPGKTLYFSSEGYLGFGGYDIYSTHYYQGDWTEPENLSAPINSSYNDIYFTLDYKNDKVLLSSNRPGSLFLEEAKEACCYDIYKGELPYLKHKLVAQIFEELTKESLPGAEVTLQIVNSDIKKVKVHPDSTEYSFKVQKNKEYMLMATKPGFMPAEISFSTKNTLDTADIIKKLYLVTEMLSLDVNIFTLPDSKPLLGANVTIISSDGETIDLVNEVGNDFHVDLDRHKTYRVLVSRKGFKPVTVTINPKDYRNVSKIVKDVYLPYGSLEDFLPLVLFFDNDHPNPGSWVTNSDLMYAETFNAFYSRKIEFINEFTSPINEANAKSQMTEKLEGFFESEVKKGNVDLQIFLEIAKNELESGKKIQIFLKGYASPRYVSSYNKALGERRIKTVKNQLLQFKDGYFKDYLSSGQLVIKEKSFGSTTAPKSVSGDMSDERMSIYSYEASKERRVEIVDVKFGE